MFQRAVLWQPSAESATAQVSVFSRANTDGFFTSAHKLWLTISAAINDVMMISRGGDDFLQGPASAPWVHHVMSDGSSSSNDLLYGLGGTGGGKS